MTVQDRQSFFAYNLWLEQRGLSRVSFATYMDLFPEALLPEKPPAMVIAPQAPATRAAQPIKPASDASDAKVARPHLVCWLIGGNTVPPALMTKIKRATCVPLSYMTQFSLADHKAIVAALDQRPAVTIVVLGCDGNSEQLPPLVASHPALWRLPHPENFQKPGVKAAFWAQLKELMAAVAETPSL